MNREPIEGCKNDPNELCTRSEAPIVSNLRSLKVDDGAVSLAVSWPREEGTLLLSAIGGCGAHSRQMYAIVGFEPVGGLSAAPATESIHDDISTKRKVRYVMVIYREGLFTNSLQVIII